MLYDSNLYHFQGIEWIKNNKIVFGLTNINYRLGQVALNWNISPLLNIFESEKNFDLFNLITFFLLFYIIYKSFEKKKKNLSDYYIIFFFFLIFFQQLKYSDLWSIFNSISSPETDISSGIFLILGIYFFLKNLENNVEINLSLLTSLLLFVAIAIKVTAYPAILVQLLFFYFLFNKNKKIFLIVFSIIFFLYFIFIIKNFVNSGCLIFPISFTCLEPFWGIEVDSLNNKYSLKKFLITVNNFSENTFSYNHVVLRYSTILLIIFFLLYLVNFKKNNKSFVNLNKFLKIIIIIFLFSLIIFFNFVKNIRFGWYNFYILFSLLFLIIANNNRLFLNKYLKPYMFILCILFLFSQSLFLLISEANFSNKNYDASYNIKHSSNFSYKLGSNEGFCFDFIPPCSNYEINKNTHLRENFYKFYYLKN